MRSLYTERSAAWRAFAGEHLPDARLVAVNRDDSERRTFRTGDRFVKVLRRTSETTAKKSRTLAAEYRVTADFASRAGFPAPRHATFDEGWELLWMDWLEGTSVEELVAAGRADDVSPLALVKAVVGLNRMGMVHRDIAGQNLLVLPTGSVRLVDLGEAQRSGRWQAAATDVLGLGSKYQGRSLRGVFWEVLASRSGRLARAVAPWRDHRARRRHERGDVPSPTKHMTWWRGAVDGCEHLQAAWGLAADPPGRDRFLGLAWSFEVAGLLCRGTTCWETIWEQIRPRIDWNGCRVAEISADLPLATTFACFGGAQPAAVVARTTDLAGAADRVAAAFDLDPLPVRGEQDVALAFAAAAAGDAEVLVALGPRTARWIDEQPDALKLAAGCSDAVLEVSRDRVAAYSRELERIGLHHVEHAVAPKTATAVLHASARRHG